LTGGPDARVHPLDGSRPLDLGSPNPAMPVLAVAISSRQAPRSVRQAPHGAPRSRGPAPRAVAVRQWWGLVTRRHEARRTRPTPFGRRATGTVRLGPCHRTVRPPGGRDRLDRSPHRSAVERSTPVSRRRATGPRCPARPSAPGPPGPRAARPGPARRPWPRAAPGSAAGRGCGTRARGCAAP